jgi:hypothetical protein
MFSQRNNPYCELLSDYKDTKLKVINNEGNRNQYGKILCSFNFKCFINKFPHLWK